MSKSAFLAQLWSLAFFFFFFGERLHIPLQPLPPRRNGDTRLFVLVTFTAVSLFGVFLTDGNVLQHIFGRAHCHGRPLVDALGLDVQDGLEAGGGHAACLLHDEGHGVALIQQAQLGDAQRIYFIIIYLKLDQKMGA